MPRRATVGSFLALAVVAELLVFVAVADRLGTASALLLCVGTTLLGLARLRRLGTAAVAALRGMAKDRSPGEGGLADGALAALGGLLLVLPGFIGDCVGLALLVPVVRRWVAVRVGIHHLRPVQGGAAPRTIELGADDWRRLDGVRHR